MGLSASGATRRPRLDDVAAEVGVSTATVSLVLRGAPGPSAATRERVLAATARLGYRPDRAASLLASRRSRSIGVLLDVGNPFHGQLVGDLHEAADRHGYDPVLSTVTRSRDETRAEETLLDSRCEALVLLGPEAPDAQLAALGARVPVVVVGRPVRSTDVDVVRVADDEGVALAVRHLADLGHRRLAYVDGGRGAVAALRRRGFTRATRRNAVGDASRVVRGGQTESDGARAARELLGAPALPTAVLTFNDRSALGLIDAFVRAGIDVPGQVSVVGYDDSPVASFAHIDLTTVDQNTPRLAEEAMTALIERLEGGRAEGREVVIPPRLVIRGTTSAPPVEEQGA